VTVESVYRLGKAKKTSDSGKPGCDSLSTH
jgi:hypothetical protein